MAHPSFTYLMEGSYKESILYLLNNYFPYGIFWFMLGIGIYAVIQAKTQDYNISGVITATYFIVIYQLDFMSFMSYYAIYIQLLLGFFIAVSIYRLLIKQTTTSQ